MNRFRKTSIAYSILFFQISAVGAVGRDELPEFSVVERAASQFYSQEKLGPKDLISRDQATTLLDVIAESGWEVAQADAIVSQVLPDSHPLVKTLRSQQGQQFGRKVSGYKLIYDRLDRVSQVSGGQRLLRNIVKLPDGHRYAATERHGFVPDLLSLLPKSGSSRKRTIKEYDKPTGKIYTPTDLSQALRDAYDAERAAAQP